MNSTSLNGFKAVLLVHQWVELDPGLQTTLTNASNAGAKIYYDGTCKDVDSVFSTFNGTALGLSFNHFENLTSVCGNDYAYLNMLNAIRGNESAVTLALAGITPPSTVSVDEVFTSESDEEQARYIFVMNNNTPTAIDPASLWNVDTFGAARVPIETHRHLAEHHHADGLRCLRESFPRYTERRQCHCRFAHAAAAHFRRFADRHRPRAGERPEYRGYLRATVRLDRESLQFQQHGYCRQHSGARATARGRWRHHPAPGSTPAPPRPAPPALSCCR